MSDNFVVNSPTSTGSTFAADEVAGVLHQRVKIQYGTDGAATDVCDATPLPVDDAGGTLTVDDGGGSLTIDGTVTAQVARTTSHVGATLNTDSLMNTTTALTPKWAVVNAALAAANDLVAAVGGKKIRVIALALFGSGTANTLYLHDDTPTNLIAEVGAAIPLDKSGAAGAPHIILPLNHLGWCETAAGKTLQMTLSAAQAVCGVVQYVEV